MKSDIAENPSSSVSLHTAQAFTGPSTSHHRSGYGATNSLLLTDGKMTPESRSYDYKFIMNQLSDQSDKKFITVSIGDKTYRIQHQQGDSAYEASWNVAEILYDEIRDCKTDIADIASNLGYKQENIDKVKDHVFYKTHKLDTCPEDITYGRFDASLEQALAWKRLEANSHNPDDLTWLKHELAEQHHEVKYGSGYREAHNRAQSRYNGYPWDDRWE